MKELNEWRSISIRKHMDSEFKLERKDTYQMGVIQNNYISHSKYVSKKFVNGRWVYYYNKPANKKTNDHKYTSKKFVNGRWVYYYDRPVNEKPLDYKYVYKEMINGKWRYYYNSEKQVPIEVTTINPSTINQENIDKSIANLKKKIEEMFNKKLTNIHNDTSTITEKMNNVSEKTNSAIEKIKNLSITSFKNNNSYTNNTTSFKNTKQYNDMIKPNLQVKSKNDYINKLKKDHKYVRKELKNGKWVYYYDDGSTVEMIDVSGVPKFETKQELLDYLARQQDIEKFPELKLLDLINDHILAESDIVNPTYNDKDADDKNRLASQTNCTSCALATEMRARGFDVESKLNLSGKDGLTVKEFRKVLNLSSYEFMNADFSELSNYTKTEGTQKWDDYHKNVVSYSHFTSSYANKMKNDFGIDVYSSNVGNGKYKLPNESKDFANEVEKEIIRKFGNRSRGILAINWKNGGSHAVNFEVKNGKITIIDNQVGTTGTVYDYTSRAYNIEFMRTDNTDISQQVNNHVKNRGEK